jgi:glycosyltransferase involved in cell wall biosynthesis
LVEGTLRVTSSRSLDVVIPSYNRGTALAETVSRVLASDLDGLGAVKVIIVDDGSPRPATDALAHCVVPAQVSLEIIRQKNGGPARARNAGYRAGSGEIVLFMDDDILPPPNLLRQHVAAHREHPASVICGPCVWLAPQSPGALFRLLQEITGEGEQREVSAYTRVPIVASGQLSIERRCFAPAEGVYRDDLVTPAAEEYELSLRLRQRGIPILFAGDIVAGHDTSAALTDVCRQQYKHGLGCGEAVRRYPETLEIEELARIVRSSGTEVPSVGETLRRLATGRRGRALALEVARLAERLAPQASAFVPLYRIAISAHFIGGVRDGLERFSTVRSC